MILLVLAFLILCYLVLFYIDEFWKRKYSPPGPWPIPILGNLIQLAKASNVPHMAVANIAAHYKEDIVRVKFGSQETLLLSSYEVLKELSNHPDAIGRFLTGFLYDRNGGKKLGIILSEGEFWERKRTWIFKTLHRFGFNKSLILESNTNEIIQELLADIDDKFSSEKPTIVNVNGLFLLPVFKIMWKMLVGRLTENDQVIILRLLHKSELMAKAGTVGPGLMTIFPILKYILPGLTGLNIHMDFAQDCKNVGRELIQETICNLSESSTTPESLTEEYAAQMMSKPNSKDFFEEDFEIVFMDLLQTSSDTVSGFLEAALLFSVLYPTEQEKVYQEILKVIPNEDKATYSHLKKMIYTQAFMTEVHRLTKITPLFLNKRTTKDFYYRGYFIKENTNIIANVHGVFHNKEVMGGDADEFRPQRFIQEDGKLGNNFAQVIPFSIGKRTCPGMAYAEVLGFLFFVNILRKYELSKVPGKPPPTREMCPGFTSKPYPFQICMEKRIQ